MDPTLVLAAGVASGTVLLFAAVGEIFAERSGVLNLGVEGMMLIGAVAGFSAAVATGNPWLALIAAMLAGGVLSLLHGVVTIHLRADQVVSGLALTFLGTGLARVLGDGLSNAGSIETLPQLTIPIVSAIPVIGPVFFKRPERADVRRLSARAGGLVLDQPHAAGPPPSGGRRATVRRRRPGHRHLSNALRLRLRGRPAGGIGRGRRSRSLSPRAGIGDQTVGGRGWIAVGLVIFAQWSPIRAAIGAYLFGAIFRFILDIQGVTTILGVANPFQAGRSATFFLEMLPYAFVIIVVILGSREALRRACGGTGGPRDPVRPRRTRRLTRGRAADPVGYSSSLVSRPSSSIWT